VGKGAKRNAHRADVCCWSMRASLAQPKLRAAARMRRSEIQDPSI
jgi:hypothetical protein